MIGSKNQVTIFRGGCEAKRIIPSAGAGVVPHRSLVLCWCLYYNEKNDVVPGSPVAQW